MIVFDLYINGEKRATTANDQGAMSLTVDKLSKPESEEIIVRLGAYEKNLKRHVDWVNESLNDGDEVKLLIRGSNETSELSSPINYREESSISDLVLQSKLKSYEILKKELLEMGLI